MAAVGELVLILGLLVSAHCEVRARDPEVEEEEGEPGQQVAAGGRGGGAVFPSYLERFLPGSTETPPLGERRNYPARFGNWCPFVQERVVTTAVVCGTEMYTIRSQSPCPSGAPNCQLIMYKKSPRPIYRQKSQTVTALLWRCCPGHGGKNCEDTVSDAPSDSRSSTLTGGSEPVTAELHDALLHGDPNREQNDHQGTGYPNNQGHAPALGLGFYQSHRTHHIAHPGSDPGLTHRPYHGINPNPVSAHNRGTDGTPNHDSGPGHAHIPDDTTHLNPSTGHAKTPDDASHLNPSPGHAHRPNDASHLNPSPGPAHRPNDASHLDPSTGHAHRPNDASHLNPSTGHAKTPDDASHLNPSTSHAHRPEDTSLDIGHAQSRHHTTHGSTDTNEQHHQRGSSFPDELDATAFPYRESNATFPDHDMMALVMSKLQPILEGFNRSLEHLSRQVGDLAHDMAQLKSRQVGTEQQAGPSYDHQLDEAERNRFNARLDMVDQKIKTVQREMEIQQTDLGNRLHSQHAMLHYNLTSFKMDIDMKLKRHQKMLQVSLQDMNTTLAELKVDQDQTTEDQLSPPSLQLSDPSGVWEAIERLNDKVVNNTVKVGGLMEDVDMTSGKVQQLRRDFKELEKLINHTARTSQIQFMETGLEVDMARQVVLMRVGELAGNLSQQGEQLQETVEDVDFLYNNLYKHNSSGDCDCKGLKAAVARLERGVANVTDLANENRIALYENSEGGAGQWGEASDWEPAVEALQRALQQVKESLALEQSRATSLDHSLIQLSSSVSAIMAEVSGLNVIDRKLVQDTQQLSNYFKTLLKDATRHSDVLERMLGEEVLEFLEWPKEDQEAHSIPALKEQLRDLQDQLRRHNLTISSLLGSRTGGLEEVLSADQPSSPSYQRPDDWLTGMSRSSGGVPARERQLLLHAEGRRPEHVGDGGDLWNLEKTVEELSQRVLQLQEKCYNTSEREAVPGGVEAKLHAEVIWLKRGLEEHLRVFKNVFSNTDVLLGSDATLELDKLLQLVRNKDGKKKRGGGGREGVGRGANHRSRRDSSGARILSSLLEDSLLVVAGPPLSVSNSIVALEPSLNSGQFYSDTGTFTAPLTGIYLFALSLHLRPGPAHVALRRESDGGLVTLHRHEVTEAGPVTGLSFLMLNQGEEVRLELKGVLWAESKDNMFTVLLLHQTT